MEVYNTLVSAKDDIASCPERGGLPSLIFTSHRIKKVLELVEGNDKLSYLAEKVKSCVCLDESLVSTLNGKEFEMIDNMIHEAYQLVYSVCEEVRKLTLHIA